MGFFSYLFYVVIPTIGFGTVVSFRLGSELPKAARRTGRSIGMGYNYLKIVLKHVTPRSTHGVDLVRKFRQTGQQAFAFSNEVKWNLLDAKPLIKEALPGLTEDPFEKFGLKQATPLPLSPSGNMNKILLSVLNEKKEIIAKKQAKVVEENTLNKL